MTHTIETYSISTTATRNGIINKVPNELLVTAEYTLKNIRNLEFILGAPILQLSGYRCPLLNSFLQGKNKTNKISQHEKAEAMDFICPDFNTPEQTVDFICKSNVNFDQLIMEGNWVHISFISINPRREVLKATFTNGKVSYTPYIIGNNI